jgi:phosphate transport system substrate-binding protein
MKLDQVMVGLALVGLLAACGERAPRGEGQPAGKGPSLIAIDGSSTVYPVSEAVAEEFMASQAGKVQITVGVSGTGGGFKKFCRGETAISNASRPISAEEIAACAETGVQFIELPVAFDALTVVVNPGNTWAQTLTVDQLNTMWSPDAQGALDNWNQVDPSFPDAPLKLFGPGADSGTFDYFTEAVMGKAKSSRGDFTASEDDNVLVTGVATDPNALGFFGYAYFEENSARLKAVKIKVNADAQAVAPSPKTVRNGTYQPLSRPVFIYVNAQEAQRPEVRDFVNFYLNQAIPLIEEVKYIPLPPRAYELAMDKFANGRTGTVFEGHSEIGVSIEDLLLRESH